MAGVVQLLTQAWRLATWIVTLRGRRGTYGTGLALVARSVPTRPGGRRGFLRGRRGTWRHPSSFHVADVVLGDIHLRFTWQAWYNYSRRRGTWRHGSSLCVAGVALGWLWWRARFDAPKKLRLPRKMTMDTSKVLRLPRKLQRIF